MTEKEIKNPNDERRIRAGERMRAFEILHEIFMHSEHPEALNALEEAQREILRTPI